MLDDLQVKRLHQLFADASVSTFSIKTQPKPILCQLCNVNGCGVDN